MSYYKHACYNFLKTLSKTIQDIKKNHEERTIEIMQFEQKGNNLEKNNTKTEPQESVELL